MRRGRRLAAISPAAACRHRNGLAPAFATGTTPSGPRRPPSAFSSPSPLSPQHASHPTRTVIGALFKFLQMAAFPLTVHAGYRWRQSTILPIQMATGA